MDDTGLPPPPAPAPLPPPPGHPPKKNSTKTVLIIIGVLAGVSLLFCLVVAGFAVWGFKKSGADKLIASAMESQNGPGPTALRARGCETAIAMNLGDSLKLEGLDAADFKMLQVVCTLGEGNRLGCDEAARVFSDAAKPTDAFNITVAEKSGTAVCDGLYLPTGERMPEPTPEEEVPGDELDMGGEEPDEEPGDGATPPAAPEP